MRQENFRACRTAAVLLGLSLLLPAAGIAAGQRLAGGDWNTVLAFWKTESGLRLLLFFPLGLGIPLIQSIWLLRTRPKRVMLLPASAALPALLPLLLFRINVLFVLFVCLALLSLGFLLTPRLSPGGRFGDFERIPPVLALKGFCLLEATGTALSLFPLLGSGEWRMQFLTGEVLFLGFLGLLYFGVSPLLRRSPGG